MADAATILKADHREVKRMLSRLADMDEGKEREQLTTELEKALTLHMDIEEKVLYPLVAQHVGADDEEEAEIEHRLAREALSHVVEMVNKPGFGAAVEMLNGGISHHVEEEEGEIFPALKDAMSRDEWRELGEAIARAKAEGGSEPASASRRRSSKRRATTAKR